MTEDLSALPALVRFLPGFIKRRIVDRPSLIKILDNIGWLFFDKILRMGVGLLVGVWVARYLGPEQFGLFNFATAFVWLFGALAGMGLQGIVVRDLVRNPSGKEDTLGTAAAMQFVGGLVAYALILVTIFWMRSGDALTILIVSILGSAMLFKGSDVVLYWFESQVQSKYAVWVQNSVFLIFATIKVALILRNASVVAFVWATVAEAFAVSLLLIVALSLHGIRIQRLRINVLRAKFLFIESWPLLFSSLVLMVQARIDQIMLGQMVGDAEVGYYSAALRVIEVATISATILRSTFLPGMVAAKNKSDVLYLSKLEKIYKINALVAIVIALPLAILSPWIINMLFGEEYQSSGTLMQLMTVRLFFAHIGVARGIFLLNENLLRYSAFTMVVGTALNIVLNYYLIPCYSGFGATIASLFSFFITIFAIDYCYDKTRGNAKMILKSIITCYSVISKKNLAL